MARALIHVPKSARRGEIVEFRALIAHPMETGFRVGLNGQLLPRDIITTFTCAQGDEILFRAEFSPAISANPFVSFMVVATEPGTITFHWIGDNGFEATETAEFTVT